MMRPNHEFFCPSALSPGFRNWVGMTCNMQQEEVGLVLLPRPASLVRSPVLPCVEAPLGESALLLADAGGEKTTGAAGAHVLGGGERGWGGDLHEEGTPAACPPGFELTIYGVGDKCVSDILFPDVVVYLHS